MHVIEFNHVFDIARKFLNGKDLIKFLQQLNVEDDFDEEDAVYIYKNINITPEEFKSILGNWSNEDFSHLIEEGYDIDEYFITEIIEKTNWEHIIKDEDNIMKLSDENFRILFEKVHDKYIPLTKDIFNRCIEMIMKQQHTGFTTKDGFYSNRYCYNLYDAEHFQPSYFDWDDGRERGRMPYYVSHYIYETEDWWIEGGDYYDQIYIDEDTYRELFPEYFRDE